MLTRKPTLSAWRNKIDCVINEKKCKGTGKAKGSGCNKLVPISLYEKPNRVYGLGKSCKCYGTWLASTEAGREVLEKATLKATKSSRDFKEFEKEEKRIKSIRYLLVNTKNACHNYIKLRDKGKPCISCQMPYDSSFQAGHFFKSELFSNIQFNEYNVNGQCQGCNLYNEGNEGEYRVHLPKRIGQNNFDDLVFLAKQYKKENFKWEREVLIEIRKYYLDKIKELKIE